jgi:hypothetical protein
MSRCPLISCHQLSAICHLLFQPDRRFQHAGFREVKPSGRNEPSPFICRRPRSVVDGVRPPFRSCCDSMVWDQKSVSIWIEWYPLRYIRPDTEVASRNRQNWRFFQRMVSIRCIITLKMRTLKLEARRYSQATEDTSGRVPQIGIQPAQQARQEIGCELTWIQA